SRHTGGRLHAISDLQAERSLDPGRPRRRSRRQGVQPASIRAPRGKDKQLLEDDPDLTPAEKDKFLKNLLTVRLANNRRVDVTLSTTGEQSVRRFPFNAKDALTLLSRAGGEKGAAAKAPAAKKPAPRP